MIEMFLSGAGRSAFGAHIVFATTIILFAVLADIGTG